MQHMSAAANPCLMQSFSQTTEPDQLCYRHMRCRVLLAALALVASDRQEHVFLRLRGLRCSLDWIIAMSPVGYGI